MTRLFITGINGFTGRHLVDFVGDSNLEIFGLTHKEEVVRPGVAAQYVADLTDRAAIRNVVKIVKPDLVVHLAGAAFVGRTDVDAFYQTNLVGTRNLLEALAGEDHTPNSVLCASSANIYGNLRSGVLSETTEPDPVNDYGVSKLAMEFVARIAAKKLPIILTRPFNYTGLEQSRDFLIPKIVDHLRSGRDHIKLGNLDIARDFSDVRDVVRAYMALLLNPLAIGETVNICSGVAHELRQVLRLAERLAGRTLKVIVDPSLVRPNEIKALWGDRSKLESLISDTTIIPLQDTLNWMLGEASPAQASEQ